jgi:pimeloyl-ACP methyl ester carboxylesterase
LSGPSSGSFVSQRLHLRFVEWGHPDAPALILLHGLLDNGRSWDWAAQNLQDDFHVFAPDMRGHGDSDHAPAGIYSTAAYLFDLYQFMRRFHHRKVVIVGHGLGGALALAYAGIYPSTVSRVVAIEGLGDPPSVAAARAAIPVNQRIASWISERQALAARVPRRYATIEDAFARVKLRNPHLSPQVAFHLAEHGTVRNEDDTYSWQFDNYVRAPGGPLDMQDEFRALWAKVACPALLLFGEETGMVRAFGADVHDMVPDAQVKTIPGAGHWAHHDQLEAFLGILRDFLEPALVA